MSNDIQRQLDDAIANFKKRMDDEIAQQHTQMMQSLPTEITNAINRANACTINGDIFGAYLNILRAQIIKGILDQKPS